MERVWNDILNLDKNSRYQIDEREEYDDYRYYMVYRSRACNDKGILRTMGRLCLTQHNRMIV